MRKELVMSKEANSTRKLPRAQSLADEAAGEKRNRPRFVRSTSAGPARKTARTTARKISSATNPRRSI